MSDGDKRKDLLKVLEKAGSEGMEERDLILRFTNDWHCHYSTVKRYITELENEPIKFIKRQGSRLYHYMHRV